MWLAELIARMFELQSGNLARFLDAIDDGGLDTRPHAGAQSVHETLLHLIRCIEFYTTSAMSGTKQPAPYRPPAFHSVAELRELLARVGEQARQRIAGFDDAFLSGTVEYNGAPVTRAECLAEMVVHGQHHLGQLQLTLRLAGRPAADIRFLV